MRMTEKGAGCALPRPCALTLARLGQVVGQTASYLAGQAAVMFKGRLRAGLHVYLL